MIGRSITMKISKTNRPLTARLRALVASESSGQALLEFALISPLILMLALGLCVFGIGLEEQLTLTNATELAAQQVAISRSSVSSSNTVCEIAESTFVNAAPSMDSTKLTFTLTLSGQGAIPTTTGASSFTSAKNCSSDTLVENQTVTLTVSYPYTASFINFGTKSYTLSSTIEQVIE
jgi:Flp pilus assembly protein TadG